MTAGRVSGNETESFSGTLFMRSPMHNAYNARMGRAASRREGHSPTRLRREYINRLIYVKISIFWMII